MFCLEKMRWIDEVFMMFHSTCNEKYSCSFMLPYVLVAIVYSVFWKKLESNETKLAK